MSTTAPAPNVGSPCTDVAVHSPIDAPAVASNGSSDDVDSEMSDHCLRSLRRQLIGRGEAATVVFGTLYVTNNGWRSEAAFRCRRTGDTWWLCTHNGSRLVPFTSDLSLATDAVRKVMREKARHAMTLARASFAELVQELTNRAVRSSLSGRRLGSLKLTIAGGQAIVQIGPSTDHQGALAFLLRLDGDPGRPLALCRVDQAARAADLIAHAVRDDDGVALPEIPLATS